MSFHDDGSFTATDSTQALGVENAGFTTQLGTYECTGRHSVNALALDFGFTDPPSIGRTDWDITIDQWTRTIEGTVILYIIPGAETADPLVTGLTPIEMFTFNSVRVPARVQ